MKKVFVVIATAAAFGMQSCTLNAFTTDHTTNNPIGNKVSVSYVRFFGLNPDFGYLSCAKKGGITKIGTVQTKVGGFIKISKMTVTGE